MVRLIETAPVASLPPSCSTLERAGSSSGPLPLFPLSAEAAKDPVPLEEIWRVCAVKVAAIQAMKQLHASTKYLLRFIFMEFIICCLSFLDRSLVRQGRV